MFANAPHFALPLREVREPTALGDQGRGLARAYKLHSVFTVIFLQSVKNSIVLVRTASDLADYVVRLCVGPHSFVEKSMHWWYEGTEEVREVGAC